MDQSAQPDFLVVGAGPNGLAAAIALARDGRRVTVFEAAATVGGGARSAELTLPGFVHDVCSAVYPLALGSPFFQALPLRAFGVHWIEPDYPLAHPLEGGQAVVLRRSVEATAALLVRDRRAYERLMRPLVGAWPQLRDDILAPLYWRPLQKLAHLPALAQFGSRALRSAAGLARSTFVTEPAQALFAGLAAHSMLPLEQAGSAAFGLVLGVAAHTVGWPIVGGGSQRLSDALAAYLVSLGGQIITNCKVRRFEALPPARAVLFDVTPRQLLSIAGEHLPERYQRQLMSYRYGPGVFKIDWALSDCIPWTNPACSRAGTVHVGGTLDEIAAGERALWRGEVPPRPFTLVVQPSLFDPPRAPSGRHTGWAYCHVPAGSTVDMTGAIENQIERFAPGFRDCILARHTMTAAQLERYDANYVGGDINGGAAKLSQTLFRPAARWNPYATGNPRIFICSSSTPPGGGVHGMCGYHAAQAALRAATG
jgi:phytoene dehydrogenase-like protein